MLADSTWDGNVRQLRNVLERACILADTDYVTESDLAGIMREQRIPTATVSAASPAVRPDAMAPLLTVEREHIVRTLQQVRGNKAVAARLLGISRRAFYRQLERHGLHQRVPADTRAAGQRALRRGASVIDTTVSVTRRTRVLVADDTESVRALFRKLLVAEGHEVIAVHDGAEALDAVQRHHPDVVLLDVGMPHLDGLEVCRRLKSDPATRLTPVVLVTGLSDMSDRIKGIEAGADEFLSKPVHPHELRARVASLSRMKHLIDALDSAEAAFMTLALTIEARDPNTNGHCERLAQHAVLLGRTLGLPPDDLNALHRGGYLHDVGKVGVPDSVLLKPGKLTAEEMELMRRHPGNRRHALRAAPVAAPRSPDHPGPSRAARRQRISGRAEGGRGARARSNRRHRRRL